MSAIIACILIFLVLYVFLHQFVIILYGVLALLACALVLLVCSLSHLHACLEQCKLITLCSIDVSYLAPNGSTLAVSLPELRIIANDCADVSDGTFIVAHIVKHECTIVESNGIVGLQLEHKVKVFYGQIVFSHTGTQESTVEMPKVIVGIEIKGGIIIRHSPSEIVLIITCKGTVDIQACHLGQLYQRLVQRVLGLSIFLTQRLEHSLQAPGLSQILVQGESLVHPLLCPYAIFQCKGDLGLEGIVLGILGPIPYHLVK